LTLPDGSHAVALTNAADSAAALLPQQHA